MSALLTQRTPAIELYFESASPDQILHLFDESYCSSLVNLLLDLKKSTTKRIFEVVVRHRKRAFLHVLALYYYKEYLTNPLPLSLETDTAKNVPNHYAILGVPRDASLDDLKTAHRILVASFSPDCFPPNDRKAGEERLRDINAAFEILKNPKRRQVLDQTLPNISYLYPRRDQSWLTAVNRLIS